MVSSIVKGVHQGNPLSPLLFYLAEDVRSRATRKLVEEGNLHLMISLKGSLVPFHLMYAGDIMIFAKHMKRNVQKLIRLLNLYELSSDQAISPQKCKFYQGDISSSHVNAFHEMLGFSMGTLPFTYLGALIFSGKPKCAHLLTIIDRLKEKLVK